MGITLTPDEERSEAFHNSNGEDRKLASWDALELCWEIEKIPASERQTVAAVSASKLRKRLLKEESERVNGQRWIAVEERLPEIKQIPYSDGDGSIALSDIVLTMSTAKKDEAWYYEASRLDSNGRWLNWKFQPTHWQPITPPPL